MLKNITAEPLIQADKGDLNEITGIGRRNSANGACKGCIAIQFSQEIYWQLLQFQKQGDRGKNGFETTNDYLLCTSILLNVFGAKKKQSFIALLNLRLVVFQMMLLLLNIFLLILIGEDKNTRKTELHLQSSWLVMNATMTEKIFSWKIIVGIQA